MNKNEYFAFRERINAFHFAQYLISWDNETIAPSNCFSDRANHIGVLSKELYNIETSAEYYEAVRELLSESNDDVLKKELNDVLQEIENKRKIPVLEYVEYNMLIAEANNVWALAKANNDYKSFEPYLEKIVSYKKKIIKYLEKEDLKDYDVLLDEYEKGYKMEDYNAFFVLLKKDLVPFVKEILALKKDFDFSFIENSYPALSQKQFSDYLMDVMDVDKTRCIMKESVHPFTSGFGSNDVRVTNHYYEEDFTSSIFSAIHELGHAIYELNVDESLNKTRLFGGASMAMHESQSRFYENIIGRSPEFWGVHYQNLVSTFPSLKNTSKELFIKYVNYPKASLIRTEADELTYPIHIMIRYDLERELFNGSLSTKDLPKRWNALYKEYLGIEPDCDSNGVLQDVHWSGGDFGYFPTYALGGAIGAQILYTMNKDFDVFESLKSGNTKQINAWLKEHIHVYGCTKTPREILEIALHSKFDAKYYIDYLKTKYTKMFKE